MDIEEIMKDVREYARQLGLQNYYHLEITGYKYSVTDDYRNSEQAKKDYEELPF